MGEVTVKVLSSFFYSWLGAGIFLQVPILKELINIDLIDSRMYHIILAITFMLWAVKYGIGVYEKWRDVKNKKYPK